MSRARASRPPGDRPPAASAGPRRPRPSAPRAEGRGDPAGAGSGALGWDHPDTARYYARFSRRFDRYREANRRLAAEADLARGVRVLDVGAGDGGTAAEVLARIGRDGTVLCFEPSAAMRALGEATLRDARVAWTDRWPAGGERFHRVVCGAAVWQLRPLGRVLRGLHRLLLPGGVLSFDVPALYLGEEDPPGGGGDPRLLELPAALMAERAGPAGDPTRRRTGGRGRPAGRPVDAATVDALLAAAGFRSRRWSFALRFGQPAYRQWLKIPPTTDTLLRGLSADERADLVDRAYGRVDGGSWRWERWLGWTAWRPVI